MKTKTILLLCLLSGIVLSQLSAQKSTKQDEFTQLGNPAPLQDKMNGKVQKVILKFYWCAGTGDNIAKGNHITTGERDSLGWFYDFEATFDNIGDHMISYNTLDDNNKPFTKYQFVRENGRIVSSKWTFGKDTNQDGFRYSKGDGYSKFTLDAKGYLVASADYSLPGNILLYKFTSKNNESGDEIEGQSFDDKGNLIQKWATTYNEKRQVTGGNWTDKDGIIAGSYSNVYNDKGKVSEVTSFDKDNKVKIVHKYSYPDYDARGNWLKVVYTNSIGQSVFCERTITYF